jgi:hypothetical protein
VGDRTVRRLLLILAGLATLLGVAGAVGAVPAAAATPCVSAANAAYHHAFDGAAGTVTVTATRPICGGQSQPVTLVSYTAGTPGTAAGQFVYDSATGRLTATNRSLTLKVAVPGCYAQVVAFFGAGVQTELTSTAAPYGSAKVDSRSAGPLTWYAGGASACTTTPTVAYAYACDGTFTATLANGSGANASAVFLTGGRRIGLSPPRRPPRSPPVLPTTPRSPTRPTRPSRTERPPPQRPRRARPAWAQAASS